MRFVFGPDPRSSFSSPAVFFFLDDLAKLGFGVGSSLRVFSSESVGLDLCVSEIFGELLGLCALATKIGRLSSDGAPPLQAIPRAC